MSDKLPLSRGFSGRGMSEPLCGRFQQHCSHARGTGLPIAGLFNMHTSTPYREFAEECERLAAETDNPRHREVLQEMAKVWRQLAETAESEMMR
jgi:hypothetical protein